MRRLCFTRPVLFVWHIFLVAACSAPSSPSTGDEASEGDANVLEINTDYYYEGLEGKPAITQQSELFSRLSIKSFGTFTDDGLTYFTYHVIDSVQLYPAIKTLLIAEDYSEESQCWIVNYDQDGILLGALRVFYDNSEGAVNLNAKLNMADKKVYINEDLGYEEPEVPQKTYSIEPNGKFIEQ